MDWLKQDFGLGREHAMALVQRRADQRQARRQRWRPPRWVGYPASHQQILLIGFESPNPLPDAEDALAEEGSGDPWIEFHVGNCSLMIDKLVGPPLDHAQLTHLPWVFVDNLEAHLARSQDSGATIVEGITTHGFTSYIALDIEGRSWRFAEARPTQPR